MTRTPDGYRDGFALAVRFTLQPGSEEKFDRLVTETTAEIAQQEPGTLIYACHTEESAEPPVRVFYELYENRDAFEAHERQPHVRRFLEERQQFLSNVEVAFLTPTSVVSPS